MDRCADLGRVLGLAARSDDFGVVERELGRGQVARGRLCIPIRGRAGRLDVDEACGMTVVGGGLLGAFVYRIRSYFHPNVVCAL